MLRYVKLLQIWQNFTFFCIYCEEKAEIPLHVEKFQISPHLSCIEIWNFSTWLIFLHLYIGDIGDKYQVCLNGIVPTCFWEIDFQNNNQIGRFLINISKWSLFPNFLQVVRFSPNLLLSSKWFHYGHALFLLEICRSKFRRWKWHKHNSTVIEG